MSFDHNIVLYKAKQPIKSYFFLLQFEVQLSNAVNIKFIDVCFTFYHIQSDPCTIRFELKSKNYSVHLNAIFSIGEKNRDNTMYSHSFYVVNLMPNKIICFSNFYK